MINHNCLEIEIVSVEKYLNKGCLSTCSVELESKDWTQLVYKTILFAQRFGYGWSISGSIEEEVNLSTTGINAGCGITLADIYISRREFES